MTAGFPEGNISKRREKFAQFAGFAGKFTAVFPANFFQKEKSGKIRKNRPPSGKSSLASSLALFPGEAGELSEPFPSGKFL